MQIINLLFDRNADFTIKNNLNQSAIDVAAEVRYK